MSEVTEQYQPPDEWIVYVVSNYDGGVCGVYHRKALAEEARKRLGLRDIQAHVLDRMPPLPPWGYLWRIVYDHKGGVITHNHCHIAESFRSGAWRERGPGGRHLYVAVKTCGHTLEEAIENGAKVRSQLLAMNPLPEKYKWIEFGSFVERQENDGD